MTVRRVHTLLICAVIAVATALAACNAGPPLPPAAAPATPVAAAPAAATADAAAPAATFHWSDLAALRDARSGKPDAQQLAGAKAAVILFSGTECPLTTAYLPKLEELRTAFGKRGVAFFAVYPDEQDSEAAVAAHAAKLGVSFPAVKDAHNALADELQATTTPEAFVVNPNGDVLYRGEVDDQYGIGIHRTRASEWYLASALEDALAGRPVAVSRTMAQGCSIARERAAPSTGAVTFSHDVAPILKNRCQSCHSPGQVGPMPLMTYDDAFAWAATIRDQVASRRMPPWGADAPAGMFANDPHLSDDEYRTLLQWIDEGGPRGSDADLPQAAGADLAAPAPDIVVSMAKPFDVPKSGVVDYQIVWSDQTFPEDVWVRAARTMPGAVDVVHHSVAVVVYPQELTPGMTKRPLEGLPGHILSVYAASPMTDLNLPAGYAKKIPKGSRIYFQLHYTTNGFARRDQTRIGLYLERAPKHQVIEALAINQDLVIPPFDRNHEETADLKMPIGGEILGFMPHTHLRGKDFRYDILRARGKKETALWVPRYDYFLNPYYRLQTPMRIEKGDTVRVTAHYDNSSGNPNNPDPSKEVRWGDGQTWDEMLVGFFEVSLDLPVDSKQLRKYDLAYGDWADDKARTAVYR